MNEINYYKLPMLLEYVLYGDKGDFFSDVQRDGFIDIYASMCRDTKTLVHMAMQKGQTRFAINTHVDGFSLKARKGFDLNYTPVIRKHFRITKKQGWNEFNVYIWALVQSYFSGMVKVGNDSGTSYKDLTVNLYMSDTFIKAIKMPLELLQEKPLRDVSKKEIANG